MRNPPTIPVQNSNDHNHHCPESFTKKREKPAQEDPEWMGRERRLLPPLPIGLPDACDVDDLPPLEDLWTPESEPHEVRGRPLVAIFTELMSTRMGRNVIPGIQSLKDYWT
ncbi:hypothetical protein TNCV_545621 [Trichonephila clavipes]|nr:hypothetical protein TNCV_545621 [Trichonephila clavipes]